jgi:hypothetical protein
MVSISTTSVRQRCLWENRSVEQTEGTSEESFLDDNLWQGRSGRVAEALVTLVTPIGQEESSRQQLSKAVVLHTFWMSEAVQSS